MSETLKTNEGDNAGADDQSLQQLEDMPSFAEHMQDESSADAGPGPEPADTELPESEPADTELPEPASTNMEPLREDLKPFTSKEKRTLVDTGPSEPESESSANTETNLPELEKKLEEAQNLQPGDFQILNGSSWLVGNVPVGAAGYVFTPQDAPKDEEARPLREDDPDDMAAFEKMKSVQIETLENQIRLQQSKRPRWSRPEPPKWSKPEQTKPEHP